MPEEQILIYTVNVNNEKVKAMDVIALKNWFMLKRSMVSLQKINLDNLPSDSVYFLVARILQDQLNELESFVDEVLGLKQEVKEVEPEVIVEKPKQVQEVPDVKFFDKEDPVKDENEEIVL